MTFDPIIITWDMLGLIGDFCGKIQLNSDKVRQSYIIKTKMRLKGHWTIFKKKFSLSKFHLSGKNWLLIYKYKKKNSEIPSKSEEIINFC